MWGEAGFTAATPQPPSAVCCDVSCDCTPRPFQTTCDDDDFKNLFDAPIQKVIKNFTSSL